MSLNCGSLVKAYCLGEKYQIHRFNVRVLESLTLNGMMGLTLTPADVGYAFEHSAVGSSLRTTLVNRVTTGIQSGTIHLGATPILNTSPPFPDPSSAAEWSALFQKGGDLVTSIMQKLGQGAVIRQSESLPSVRPFGTIGSFRAPWTFGSLSRVGSLGSFASVPPLGSFGSSTALGSSGSFTSVTPSKSCQVNGRRWIIRRHVWEPDTRIKPGAKNASSKAKAASCSHCRRHAGSSPTWIEEADQGILSKFEP